MIYLISLIVGVVTTTFIILAVYEQDRRSLTNKLFVGLGLCLVGWTITTYFSLHTHTGLQTLHWIRWIMLFVVLQNTVILLLAKTFPSGDTKPFSRLIYRAFIGYSLVVAAVAISPYLFVRFQHDTPQAGPGMALFLLHAILVIVGSITLLIKKYRQANGLPKAQLRSLLLGIILLLLIEPACNFILPVVLKDNTLVTFSPLYAIGFSALIAYAILRHQLFYIHSFVVRAAAYLFTIILLSLLYIIPSILVVAFILHIHFTWPRFWVAACAAVLLAICYRKVRDSFDSLTHKLFFRGYYEPQDILNQLSEILVRSIDVGYIKRQSARILREAIHTDCFGFWLPADTEKSDTQGREVVETLQRLFKGSRPPSLIVVDEVIGGSEVAQFLHEKKIALAVRLRVTNDNLGFLTLDFRESGEPYSEKDRRLLSIAADEIAISLQNALYFEETQHFNRHLQEKVADATRELRRSNDRLKALDETKDDFISMASHQLRTPLTSVKGYLSLVLEGDAGKLNAQQRKLLTQSFVSAQRMVYLISDLLNVSRLQTGKFVIIVAPVNLADVVTDEVAQLQEAAAGRSLTLSYNKPAGFPELMLDETKVRQVVMNFIDNAIYYTPTGGRIDVMLVNKSSAVELKVIDNGIGVPKAEQHHLFTKFYRAGNARRARPDGTGLGLFMAKKVITAQGGSLIFESQEGKGSTFGFTFSKSKLAKVPAEVIAA